MADQVIKPHDRYGRWERELEMLRDIFSRTELQEASKWGGLTYTYKGKNVLGIGGFKHYFAIWFYNGVFLTDPKAVLVNAGEGVTKSLRQWRFTSAEEIDKRLILQYTRECILNEDEGRRLKAVKTVFAVPEWMQQILSDNGLTESFSAFPMYKQKEFVEHIESAKREQTRLDRITKAIDLIRTGIGLHDKFRK